MPAWINLRTALLAAASINAFVALFAAGVLFLFPALILLHDLRDPGLRNGEVPKFAFRWHERLTDNIEPWARGRVASGRAETISVMDISGSEWPLFTCVFYLLSTVEESLEMVGTIVVIDSLIAYLETQFPELSFKFFSGQETG